MNRLFFTIAMVFSLFLSGEVLAEESRADQSQGLWAQQGRGPHRRPAGKRPQRAAKSQGERVRVQVLLVHATSGEPFMDADLNRWSRHLKHLRYDRFELLDRRRASLLPDQARDFEILCNRSIKVSLLSKTPKRARLRVQMYRRNQKLVDTTVTVNRNGTFIMAGPSHKGGILVMPITASY